MPNRETTFADRLQRGRAMNAATVDFTPAFAPADTSLEPATFEAFLESIEGLNTNVSDAQGNYGDFVDQRMALAKTIRDRTTRALAYIKSNKVWASHLPRVKKLADKMRSIRPKKSKKSEDSDAPVTPDAKKRSQGESSYSDLEGQVAQFTTLLQQVTGYSPPAAELTIPQFETDRAALRTLNLSIPDKLSALTNARAQRRVIYDEPDGLREKMLSIKQATLGQYGLTSPQFEAIKSIRG